jgi:hypothetical protein
VVRGGTTVVLGLGYWFEVAWVAAPSIAAQVVYMQTLWDWTHHEFVCHPMRAEELAASPSRANEPIASFVTWTGPFPALSSSLDTFPQSFGKRS